jgi:hypothetical protein
MRRLPQLAHLYKRDGAKAAAVLFLALNACFFQCLWGNKTLLTSARDAPSVVAQGAWTGNPPRTNDNFGKVLDPGGAAWQEEAWNAVIHREYFQQGTVPLWNPYQGFGQPLAANMQSQPFFPLTVLLAVHLTPRTYNGFVLSRIFLAGLFLYLYLRLWLSFYPALAGGLCAMLAGYYLLFLQMPHISVEMLLPLSLFSGEVLLRKRNFTAVLLFAATALLAILGGMPESTLLLFSFLYLYLIVRLSTDATLRSGLRIHVGLIALATVAGLCLAAFLVLPFLQYMQLSSNSHDPAKFGGYIRGLMHDARNVSVFTYIFPLLLGPANSHVLNSLPGVSPLRNYVGIVSFYFILIAVITACRRDQLRVPTLFFAGCIAFVVLKRYGLLINWVGILPGFRLTDFPKYDEAALSISAAVLCAIGLERVVRAEVTTRVKLAVCGGLLLLVPLAVYLCRRPLMQEFSTGGYERAMAMHAVAVGLCFAAALFIWVVATIKSRSATVIAVPALFLLAGELALAYLVPVNYSLNRLPKTTANPYQGAPFVEELQARTRDHSRIFGRDSILWPNWAGVFGLSDIRDLDAMYNQRYFPFLRTFFPEWSTLTPDFESCFIGRGDYSFKTPLQRRLLQLSSVKYIVTERPFTTPDPVIDAILAQNQGHLEPGHEGQISHTSFEIAGDARETLFEHPPYQRLPFRVNVPKDYSMLDVSYGINPRAFDKAGDGVGFTVELRAASGKIVPLFSNYIDPKHTVAERKWMTARLDLSAYRGQTVEVLFSTDPGPRGDPSYDWAGWSAIHFEGQSSRTTEASQPFRQIYDGDDAKIYSFDHVLPRAAIFYKATLVANDKTVLQHLADPHVDVFQAVVLDSKELNASSLRNVQLMNAQPLRPAETGTIDQATARGLTITAAPDRPAILMLNDAAFPGWTATVDGHRVDWFHADYLFRGLLLAPGRHVIRFSYRPWPFVIGACISASTLIILLLTAWYLQSRKAVAQHRRNRRSYRESAATI